MITDFPAASNFAETRPEEIVAESLEYIELEQTFLL